jgi:hypothetical protein
LIDVPRFALSYRIPGDEAAARGRGGGRGQRRSLVPRIAADRLIVQIRRVRAIDGVHLRCGRRAEKHEAERRVERNRMPVVRAIGPRRDDGRVLRRARGRRSMGRPFASMPVAHVIPAYDVAEITRPVSRSST